MIYDFDTVINRHGTYSSKYDGASFFGISPRPGFIPLMVADMDFATAKPIVDAMHRVADFNLYGYSNDHAEPRFAEAICHWWRKHFEATVLPEQIVYSNGTCEAINCAIQTFTNVGDGVIIQRPVYGHFNGIIEEECHRKVVDNRLICDDGYYTMDFELLERQCADPANRAMILCSPANPVGRVWSREELSRVCEITRRHNVLLICDEIHCDLVRQGVTHTTILNVTSDYSNIILISGINKTFNVAGLQASHAIIPDKFLRSRFTAAFGYRTPTPFTIAAVVAGYTQGEEWLEQVRDYIDGNIDFVIEFLGKQMPWVKVRRPQGTYCLWLDFSACGLSPEEIHRRIYDEANVYLQDGYVHDPEQGGCFQRVCTPCARSVLTEAMQRIANAFCDVDCPLTV